MTRGYTGNFGWIWVRKWRQKTKSIRGKRPNATTGDSELILGTGRNQWTHINRILSWKIKKLDLQVQARFWLFDMIWFASISYSATTRCCQIFQKHPATPWSKTAVDPATMEVQTLPKCYPLVNWHSYFKIVIYSWFTHLPIKHCHVGLPEGISSFPKRKRLCMATHQLQHTSNMMFRNLWHSSAPHVGMGQNWPQEQSWAICGPFLIFLDLK